jgi:hypothetical protein
MAGELSKKIGEEGEALARNFLKRIGWPIVAENIDIPCGSPSEHGKSQKREATHGVDFIIAYDCPLVHSTRRNILVSMKNSNIEKTKNEETRVRDNLKDLDSVISCYKRSSLRSEINRDSEAHIIEDSGILIKINRDKDEAESFLKSTDTNVRLDINGEHEIHFIENKRFDLVDLAMKWLFDERRDGQTWSFYPSTTSNYAADVAEIEGNIIPLHHIVAGPLTFRHIENGRKELIIFSPTEYSRNTFERLVGLANGCSAGWASHITIVFWSLSIEQRNESEEALRGVKSKELAQSVKIVSMDPRTRII